MVDLSTKGTGMTIYEKYCQLDIDGRWIGLEKSDMCVEYFCTPIDAIVIGWENSIHYCFIKGYRDMVFAVNPETCVDKYVYPLAANFKEFLRLILACGSTTAVEQIFGWSKEQFEDFLHSDDNKIFPEQAEVLKIVAEELKLQPMEEPYEYVKAVQELFDDGKIKYSNEYYDVLGLERPDGSEGEQQLMAFEEVVFSFVKKNE